MPEMNDHLAKVLGLSGNATSSSPFPTAPPPVVELRPPVASANTGDVLSDDSRYARDNLYDVVTKTQEAINEMMEVAKNSQHPRSFEVLNMLLRTQAEVAHQLIKLEQDKAKARKEAGAQLPKGANVQIANAAIFVGTSADLLRTIQGKTTSDGSSLDATD